MPNIKSAKKRLRQSLIRRARNRSVKATLKSHVKKVRAEIAAGNIDEANAAFKTLQVKLDRAAAKNVIHANAAGRVKSRLSAAIVAAKKAKS
ncbi:MAG: 30S ribosomal protein S20 [Planctomycetaceae bacterium]|nr:30S ribosomal protein S20 [Planctomycetaceae bacterium]